MEVWGERRSEFILKSTVGKGAIKRKTPHPEFQSVA